MRLGAREEGEGLDLVQRGAVLRLGLGKKRREKRAGL